MRQLKKVLSILMSIILLSIFIRVFIGEPCRISNGSMTPTIMEGDWLWIDKVSYGASLPIRWSEIPLINIFTWIPSLRKKDLEINWGYHRLRGLKVPQKNDVIIFKSPENKELLLVKRISQVLPKGSNLTINPENFIEYKMIISQENNTVELQNDTVLINGKTMNTYQLQNSYFFVLGDNLDISRDSRHFGFLREKDIVGRVNGESF